MDRYPKIFNFLSENYQDSLKILSFGCSSGEECFSLRKYFLKSKIFGVDANDEILKEAIKNNNDNNIYFDNSIMNIESVDMIFAMSVFCKHPESFDLLKNTVYNFKDYNEEVKKLDSKLNKNGIFINYNSNYFFSDTDVYYKYSPILGDFEKEFVKKFDKNKNYSNLESPVIFIKNKV
jgi:hypothetical protein